MHWLIHARLRLRHVVVLAAALLIVLGIRLAETTPGRRVPRVRAADGGDSDRGAGSLEHRGRAAGVRSRSRRR